jgi:arginine decarboxylase
MEILIASGVGSGPTKLSAFDAALNHAGIANYNLLRLSSVIPPNSKLKVIESKSTKNEISKLPGNWGDRLYIVMAEYRVDTPNAEAWAGIGWVQDNKTGKGLFVEHEGGSEKTVRKDIKDSLSALMATRNVDFGEIYMIVSGATCTHLPVCSLVVAIYQSSDWSNVPSLIES